MIRRIAPLVLLTAGCASARATLGGELPSIAAAIAALPAKGGTVVLPEGTFHERVTIRSPHVTIAGAGDRTRLARPPESEWTGWSDTVIDVEADDVTIRSLAIVGGASANHESNQAGVHVGAVSRCAIDHVRFTGGSADEGLDTAVVLDGSSRCDVRENRIEKIVGTGDHDGNGYGILVNGEANVIAENEVAFSRGRGRHCIYLAVASFNVVAGNLCQGGENEAIPVFSYPKQAPSRFNWIVGNVIRDVRPTAPALPSQAAIALEQNVENNHVAGNEIDRVGMHGIWVSDLGEGPSPAGNRIERNVVRGAACGGIVLAGAVDTLVAENLVDGASERAPAGTAFAAILVLNSAAAPVVENNRILRNRVVTSGHEPFALTIQEGSRGTVVAENLFGRGTQGSIADLGERSLLGP